MKSLTEIVKDNDCSPVLGANCTTKCEDCGYYYDKGYGHLCDALEKTVKTAQVNQIFDPVQRPKHYNSHPSGVECITITRHLTFNIGNAIKYLWRAGLKDALVQDLEKAVWYIQDEIVRLKGQK